MRNASVTSVSHSPQRPVIGRMFWRVAQFGHALGTRHDPAIDARLQALLGNDAQWALLRRLSPFDRAHHLRVYDILLGKSCDDPDVLVAALLHDVGKADDVARAHAGHRALKVLMSIPGLSIPARIAKPSGRGPRHGVYLALHHAELGARLASAAGASERSCGFIARHDRRVTVDDPALRLLIQADEEAIR